jgi:hypothetical protein
MAISVVQRAIGVDPNGSNGYVAANFTNNTAGNTIIVCIAIANTTTTGQVAPTDYAGNTYTLIGNFSGGTQYTSQLWYIANNISAYTGANTVASGDVAASNIHIWEVAGLASTATLDKSASTKAASGTALVTASVTTTVANELILGVFCNDILHETWTLGTGYSNLETSALTQPNAFSSASEENIVTATGNYTAAITAGHSSNNMKVIMTFKGAATVSTNTQTAIATLAKSITKTQRSTARLSHDYTKTQPSISRISNSFTQTQSSLAHLSANYFVSQSATATIIINTNLATTQSTISRIAIKSAKNQNTVARIAKIKSNTQPTVARVALTLTGHQTASAHVTTKVVKTQSSSSRIANRIAHIQTASAHIVISLSPMKNQPALARLAANFTKQQPTTAHIIVNVLHTKTQTSLAQISHSSSATQLATAHLSASFTKTQITTAHIITNTNLATTQLATARTSQSGIKLQTSVSRISLSSSRAQSTTARLSQTYTASQSATASLTYGAPSIYSYGSYDILPSDNAPLSHIYTGAEVTTVSTVDGVFVNETSNRAYGIHQFAHSVANLSAALKPSWTGKIGRPASVAPVTMQVYNLSTSRWETLASNTTAAGGSVISLTGTSGAPTAHYYDGSMLCYVRVYQ